MDEEKAPSISVNILALVKKNIGNYIAYCEPMYAGGSVFYFSIHNTDFPTNYDIPLFDTAQEAYEYTTKVVFGPNAIV